MGLFICSKGNLKPARPFPRVFRSFARILHVGAAAGWQRAHWGRGYAGRCKATQDTVPLPQEKCKGVGERWGMQQLERSPGVEAQWERTHRRRPQQVNSLSSSSVSGRSGTAAWDSPRWDSLSHTTVTRGGSYVSSWAARSARPVERRRHPVGSFNVVTQQDPPALSRLTPGV